MATCVVTRNGDSETVELPAAWRKSNHIKAGDVLEVDSSVEGQITFRVPVSANKAKAARELLALVDSMPGKPWDGTAEPADDKRLIEQRHE